MAGQRETPQRTSDRMLRSSRRTALAVIFVVTVGVLLLASPGVHSAWAYWTASAGALVGALALVVVGERIWDQMLASARAAGVVAPPIT
ncbi:MAG: hypothetical protein K0U78_20700 [Actinomycetia bacterium]|nr:hypothetical protein [Actinomycetes bacterium]MCH9736940.1 hypothetical protein [Actinomycetes bacterium]